MLQVMGLLLQVMLASLVVMGVRCGWTVRMNVTGEAEGDGLVVTDGRADGSDGGGLVCRLDEGFRRWRQGGVFCYASLTRSVACHASIGRVLRLVDI